MKNHKYRVKSNLLLQQGFKPGLAERLNAWLTSAENSESLQKQLYCCANASSDQDFTTLRPPPHFPPPPSSRSPRSPPTTPTTFPPATSCPSSPPEPCCPPATTSCLSVLASRYHNLLIALLGAYLWLYSHCLLKFSGSTGPLILLELCSMATIAIRGRWTLFMFSFKTLPKAQQPCVLSVWAQWTGAKKWTSR